MEKYKLIIILKSFSTSLFCILLSLILIFNYITTEKNTNLNIILSIQINLKLLFIIVIFNDMRDIKNAKLFSVDPDNIDLNGSCVYNNLKELAYNCELY